MKEAHLPSLGAGFELFYFDPRQCSCSYLISSLLILLNLVLGLPCFFNFCIFCNHNFFPFSFILTYSIYLDFWYTPLITCSFLLDFSFSHWKLSPFSSLLSTTVVYFGFCTIWEHISKLQGSGFLVSIWLFPILVVTLNISTIPPRWTNWEKE